MNECQQRLRKHAERGANASHAPIMAA